jgi:hypothetical protein
MNISLLLLGVAGIALLAIAALIAGIAAWMDRQPK